MATKKTEKQKVVNLKLSNCMDCPHHSVQADPDPNDWFNDDDVKWYAKKLTKILRLLAVLIKREKNLKFLSGVR